LATPTTVALRNQINAAQALGQVPENDFVYFYAMGHMFNEYPVGQLYNFGAQQRACAEVHPTSRIVYGPNAYHPLIGVLFRPFARLTYLLAYELWLFISLGLYLAGLSLFVRDHYPNEFLKRSLILCFALAFYPFFWDLTGGQVATIGFFVIAAAFREEARKRYFLSGVILSVCLYKPTLLTLLLPMLLVTKRYYTIVGFLSGGVVTTGLVTAVQGVALWPGYVRTLLSFGSEAVKAHSFKILWYYVDLATFSALIPGGRSWPGKLMFASVAAVLAFELFRAWRRSAGASAEHAKLIWAATLTWTLTLNVYVPIYDAVLIVLSAISTDGLLTAWNARRLRSQFRLLYAATFICSWFTVPVAHNTKFQMITVMLALIGVLQLITLRRVSKGELPLPEATPALVLS